MGKIISVTGPSFSGKTYLVVHLLKDIPEAKIVNFEKHYNKKDIKQSYKNFYDDIERLSNDGHIVICESVYSPEHNPVMEHKFAEITNVVSLPDISLHSSNYKGFLRQFGWEVTKKRLAGCSIEQLRKNYLDGRPKKYILYNGKNYSEVIRQIRGEICG